jgi:hypothetical protein
VEGDQMSAEGPDSPKLPRLLSVPGLMVVAIFGISVIVVSRLFGPENILREIVTELLASFGSTILLLAGHPAGRPSRNPWNASESFCRTSMFEGGSLKVPWKERSWTGSKQE